MNNPAVIPKFGDYRTSQAMSINIPTPVLSIRQQGIHSQHLLNILFCEQ